MKKGLKNNQGFTMIELIVVIVIIGILAAIAVPRYLDLREQAQRASWQGMVGSIRAAASLSYANAVVQDPPLVPSAALVDAQLADKGILAGAGPWTATFTGPARVCTATWATPATVTEACVPAFP